MTASASTVRRLVVTGCVQGVGFRYAFADEARTRKLTGWVRNCADGTVEAIVAGDAAEVDAIVIWAHEGPPAARVSSVEVEAASGAFSSFEIAATAR